MGRYSAPVKIKTEVKTVTVEKVVYKTKTDTKNQKHRKVIIVDNKKPTGEETKTTTITDDDTLTRKTDKDVAKDDTKKADITKEVTKESGHVTISVLAGTNFTGIPGSGGILYGAQVQRNLIGPVIMGVWGISNGTGGASLGLQF